MNDASSLLQHLSKVEEMAEELLADKQQLIDLDRRRHKTREAIKCLQKDKTSEKSWICFGNMFIKIHQQAAVQLLEKDYDQLDEEIQDTRNNLKPKVSKLRDLEHKDNLKGFDLNPLSRDEMRAVEKILNL